MAVSMLGRLTSVVTLKLYKVNHKIPYLYTGYVSVLYSRLQLVAQRNLRSQAGNAMTIYGLRLVSLSHIHNP